MAEHYDHRIFVQLNCQRVDHIGPQTDEKYTVKQIVLHTGVEQTTSAKVGKMTLTFARILVIIKQIMLSSIECSHILILGIAIHTEDTIDHLEEIHVILETK